MNYLEHQPIPAWQDLNSGLICPTPRFMVDHVGNPRTSYSDECQPPTNEAFKMLLAEVDLGPFKVEGHAKFLAAVKAGFEELGTSHPDLVDQIGTAGALCCRWIRGYPGVLSNHSFGCAIDLKVGGILVPLGADWWTVGHSLIYGALHKQGIFSGAGYKGRKDPMHWEASETLVESFI